ncbi:hypothetical protein HZU38_05595 [Mycolicibacterium vanbaalenii]|uniref:hypothetical protein n=1 Tax=Mycolicibacterium vanbaalenii TaxID=110539 RepID=UPI001F1ED30F|nr:hypothetical protein [Mycolicibacterium vanbaalenii]UJL29974.1 hypothetical protein HZU38_05595 [Mycolicibacterium vanbaalenii]WND56964.1 hypothetical protein QQA43_00680 [Mycolicibacterium vanbaalenii]
MTTAAIALPTLLFALVWLGARLGRRAALVNQQINADVAALRAIPSTSPAPAQAASHAEVGSPSSVTTTGAELGGDR